MAELSAELHNCHAQILDDIHRTGGNAEYSASLEARKETLTSTLAAVRAELKLSPKEGNKAEWRQLLRGFAAETMAETGKDKTKKQKGECEQPLLCQAFKHDTKVPDTPEKQAFRKTYKHKLGQLQQQMHCLQSTLVGLQPEQTRKRVKAEKGMNGTEAAILEMKKEYRELFNIPISPAMSPASVLQTEEIQELCEVLPEPSWEVIKMEAEKSSGWFLSWSLAFTPYVHTPKPFTCFLFAECSRLDFPGDGVELVVFFPDGEEVC